MKPVFPKYAKAADRKGPGLCGASRKHLSDVLGCTAHRPAPRQWFCTGCREPVLLSALEWKLPIGGQYTSCACGSYTAQCGTLCAAHRQANQQLGQQAVDKQLCKRLDCPAPTHPVDPKLAPGCLYRRAREHRPLTPLQKQWIEQRCLFKILQSNPDYAAAVERGIEAERNWNRQHHIELPITRPDGSLDPDFQILVRLLGEQVPEFAKGLEQSLRPLRRSIIRKPR